MANHEIYRMHRYNEMQIKRELEQRRYQSEYDYYHDKIRHRRNDIFLAKEISDRLRGMSISIEAYNIIRNAIEASISYRRYDRYENPWLEDVPMKWEIEETPKEDFLSEDDVKI